MEGLATQRRWSDRALCCAFRAMKPLLQAASIMLPKGRVERPWMPPQAMDKHLPTGKKELDASIDVLSKRRRTWAATSDLEKAKLLQQCMENVVLILEEAAELAHSAKGRYESGIGEEMFAWVTCILFAKETINFLTNGTNSLKGVTCRDVGNQKVCTVLPTGLDCLLYAEYRGEVWLQPGKPVSVGKEATSMKEKEQLSLVLGAGNQIPIIFGDIVHKLFVESSVCVLKFSPVNDYNGTLLEKIFQPLLDLGVLRFAYGGPEVGAFLAHHEKVDTVHLTGSAPTFNTIVWGDREGPRKGALPLLNKRITAELGGCTPYIVFPGTWAEWQLDYIASQIVAGKVHNSGHNCLSAEIVLTARGWKQRKYFLDRLKFHFDSAAQRVPYYPGSASAYTKFKGAWKSGTIKELGTSGVEGAVPWILVEDLDPTEADCTEHWCGVMQEVVLDVVHDDLDEFARVAVNFVNERCAGQLSCSVWASKSMQEQLGDKWEDHVIVPLQYGSIAVNTSALPAFGFSRLGWGAFPGNTLDDIGSGNTIIHNSLRFDFVQKSVLYCPIPVFPTAIWLHNARNPEKVAKAAANYFSNPGILALAKLAYENIRS